MRLTLLTTAALLLAWLADWTPPPTGTFERVSCGGTFACASRADGTVACWGQDTAREPPAGSFKTLGLGWWHGCGIRADDQVVCWGADVSGETRPPE